MNLLGFLHRHKFNPDGWYLVRTTETYGESWLGYPHLPIEIEQTYSNRCKTCGDIVFRKVTL